MSRVNLSFGTFATLQNAYEGSLAVPGPAVIQTSGGLPVSVGPGGLLFTIPLNQSFGLAPATARPKSDRLALVNYSRLSPIDAGDETNPGSTINPVLFLANIFTGGFFTPNTGRIKFAARYSLPFFSPTVGTVISESVALIDCTPTGNGGSFQQFSNSTLNPNYSVLTPAGIISPTSFVFRFIPVAATDQTSLFRSWPGRDNFIFSYSS